MTQFTFYLKLLLYPLVKFYNFLHIALMLIFARITVLNFIGLCLLWHRLYPLLFVSSLKVYNKLSENFIFDFFRRMSFSSTFLISMQHISYFALIFVYFSFHSFGLVDWGVMYNGNTDLIIMSFFLTDE